MKLENSLFGNKEQIQKTSQKKLKRNLDEDNLTKNNSVKNELDVIYDQITEGRQIRDKCDWYENDEKQRGYQNTMTDQAHILEEIREFYKTLFKKREQKTAIEMEFFSVMLTFRISLKIKQNFKRKI